MNAEPPRNSPVAERQPHDKKRLLFLVTEFYYFRSHKMAVADRAAQTGFDVIVAARPDNSCPTPKTFEVRDLNWRRSGSLLGAAFQLLPELLRVRRLLRDVKPDVLHNIALKPAIIGSLAAMGTNVKVVNSINGFGFLFHDQSILAKIAQKVCGAVLRLSTRTNDARIVLQNKDDEEFVRSHLKLPERHVRLIAGSGVDTAEFTPQPEPTEGPFKFLILARLLYIKGIQIAVDAHANLRSRGHTSELVICGTHDAGNPSSIPPSLIAQWSKIPGVTFSGQVTDVRPLIAQCHTVLHPALGGEGLPKALLEAAASGRPMIASDVRGNREVVVPDETGLLVPSGSPEALAEAMDWIIGHPVERAHWAKAARARVISKFALNIILEQHSALYREFGATQA